MLRLFEARRSMANARPASHRDSAMRIPDSMVDARPRLQGLLELSGQVAGTGVAADGTRAAAAGAVSSEITSSSSSSNHQCHGWTDSGRPAGAPATPRPAGRLVLSQGHRQPGDRFGKILLASAGRGRRLAVCHQCHLRGRTVVVPGVTASVRLVRTPPRAERLPATLRLPGGDAGDRCQELPAQARLRCSVEQAGFKLVQVDPKVADQDEAGSDLQSARTLCAPADGIEQRADSPDIA